jgi:hypothetical protein
MTTKHQLGPPITHQEEIVLIKWRHISFPPFLVLVNRSHLDIRNL